MFYRRTALAETFRSSTLGYRSCELRYREKWLCLFTSGVALKLANDRSVVRRLSILLAQSDTSLFFGVQLKGDWYRAPVDWERASLFSNAVLFTLRSSSRSSSSSWCLVSSSFFCISSSSFLRSNPACSIRILVLNSTSNFFIFSSRLCFAEMFPKHSPMFPQLCWRCFQSILLRCPLGSCCCSRCLSLLELCCFALHSLLVACLCLYMQAHDLLTSHFLASFRCSSTEPAG